MVFSQGRGSSVASDAMELIHRLENVVIDHILVTLYLGSFSFVEAAHNCIHRSRWSIWSTKALVAVFNGLVCATHDFGCFDTNGVCETLAKFVLIDARGYFLCSCNFVETFEVLIVDFFWLQGLLIIQPFGGYYSRLSHGLKFLRC